MRHKVLRALSEYSMLNSADKVLVGFSGGADSTALLLVLAELGFDVSAIHINHCLRGEESDSDERFCTGLCAALSIPLFVSRVDVNAYCEKNGVGVETGARELRYAEFERFAQGGKIATAHHAEDSLETALLNLSRGTALKGLCGVPPKRDNIIRPLIFCTRADIEKYLAEKNQSFVTDSTNLLDFCARNKLRHNVLPVLKEINPKAADSFANTSSVISADDEYLNILASKTLETLRTDSGISAERLCDEHVSIIRRVIAMLLAENCVEVSFERIESVISVLNGGKVNLQKGVYCVCEKGIMRFVGEKSKRNEVSFAVRVNEPFDFFDKKVTLSVENVADKDSNIHKMFTKCCLDYGKIKGSLIARNRRDGDKVRLCNRGFEIRLKKLFNSDIPVDRRESVLVLCDEGGIVFVEGYGAAQRVCIDDNTEEMLIVSCQQT